MRMPHAGWTRGRLVRIIVLWTLFMLIMAIALATEAMLSLNQAEQACFFNFPATPCPGADDPALTRLTVAFVGVPLAWGIGVVVIGLAWSVNRRNVSRNRDADVT
jgi:Na+/proline symporter